jgi:hypothetical protein
MWSVVLRMAGGKMFENWVEKGRFQREPGSVV